MVKRMAYVLSSRAVAEKYIFQHGFFFWDFTFMKSSNRYMRDLFQKRAITLPYLEQQVPLNFRIDS